MAPHFQQNSDDGLQHAPAAPPVGNYHEAPQSYNTSGSEFDSNTQPALEVENSYPPDTTFENPDQSSPGFEKQNQPSHGVPRSTWILRIALATVIVIAAIIIGVVGGLLGRKKSNSTSSSPAAPSASQTTTLAIISNSTLTISRDCPGSNGTTVVTNDGPPQTFVKNCGWLYSLSDSIHDNHTAFQSTTSTLDACISLCASYNVLNGTGPQGNCSTVAWRTDVTQEYFGVCFGNFGAIGPGLGGDRSSREDGYPPTDSALLLE